MLAGEADVARLAAIDLLEAGMPRREAARRRPRGLDAAGYPTEASPGTPADAECIDYLFFVHDRHAGNREAMRQYLAWETGLLAPARRAGQGGVSHSRGVSRPDPAPGSNGPDAARTRPIGPATASLPFPAVQ